MATFAAAAQAATPIVAQFPQTRVTAETYDLHLGMLCGVLATYLVVLAVMFHSVHAHRRAAARASPPFHRHALVEFLWTAVPWIILFGLSWPAAAILAGSLGSSHADITIKATGLQWKWGYEYLKGDGAGVSFFANLYAPRKAAADATPGAGGYLLEVDNPVVVPVNRKIRIILAADDEIHSWHVPGLGVKAYAVPGLARDTWFQARRTGTYRGLCDAESCGAGRACVLIVVKVVSEGEYRVWVDGKRRERAVDAGGPGGTRRANAPAGDAG